MNKLCKVTLITVHKIDDGGGHTDHLPGGGGGHTDPQVGGGGGHTCDWICYGSGHTDPQVGGGGSIVLLQSSLLGIMWLKDK